MSDERPILAVALAPDDDAAPWIEGLRSRLPAIEVVSIEDEPDPQAVRYVAAWKHQHGTLARFTRLKALFALGAGVDHLLADRHLPAGVPIVRVVNPDLTARMSEWVMLHVLMHHRQQRLYDYQQFEKIWDHDGLQPVARDVRVGVMGFGVLGEDAAGKLRAIGFDVAAWSRKARSAPGIRSFSGRDGLRDFLNRTHILVCLLPLTPATRGILDLELFRQLARDGHAGGPILLNAGRGGLQKEADIIEALELGVLRAATLDVFETEPLPKTSELWRHPGVTISPHNAAISHPVAIAGFVADQVLAHEAGAPLAHVVDPREGY